MRTIEQLLDGERSAAAAPWLLRPPQNGDIGWVVGRHGALYAREYGWDWRFEALVARIAADFVDRFDPAREACWIAERDGSNVGCVFLVQARDESPQQASWKARRSCACCWSSRRRAASASAPAWSTNASASPAARGYRRIVLWTNSVLGAARAIYTRAGYVLTSSEPHQSFGHMLVGETWELALDQALLADAHRVDRRQVLRRPRCQLSPASSLAQQLPVVLAISSRSPPASTARPWR